MSGDLQIIPFGKYRGQPVDVLAQDAEYREWLMAQPWFAERYSGIRTLIINNFAAPTETPEHNALQARFLDPQWVGGFIVASMGGRDAFIQKIETVRRERLAYVHIDHAEKELADTEAHCGAIDASASWTKARIEEARAKVKRAKEQHALLSGPLCPPHSQGTRFEDAGADVVFMAACRPLGPCIGEFRVECKPSVGDDYPATLRQMKANKCNVLLIGDGGYTGRGATLDQMRAIFAASGIKVVLLADVPAAEVQS